MRRASGIRITGVGIVIAIGGKRCRSCLPPEVSPGLLELLQEACCVRVVRDLAYVAAGGLECSSVINDASQLHHLLCTALVHHLPESGEERLLCVNLGVERKHLFKSTRQLVFVL